MKALLRYFLINLASLFLTTELIRGLSYNGGIRTLLLGGLIFTIINFLLVPLIKVMLLPLNLLTLGLFAWITNVLALYALTTVYPAFRLTPFMYPGFDAGVFIIPPVDLSTLWVAVLASFLIGVFTHFLQWLAH